MTTETGSQPGAIAWGDESYSAEDGRYSMAFSVLPGRVDLGPLERLKPRGARKLHWSDMSKRDKRKALRAVSAMPASHLVVSALGTARTAQERARHLILKRALPALERAGVEVVHLEARQGHQDERDARLVHSLQMAGYFKLRVDSLDPSRNGELWVPDQVLGFYQDFYFGDNQRLRGMWGEIAASVSVDEFEV